jgi:hypothetical protein
MRRSASPSLRRGEALQTCWYEPTDSAFVRNGSGLATGLPSGLKERQDRAALQLAADNHLTRGINSVNLEADLAMSRPIVVIVCMGRSSESWEPYQRPHSWHSRAGGGAVHSIKSGNALSSIFS